MKKALFVLCLISSGAMASDGVIPGGDVALYNIGNGDLVYSYKQKPNSYLYADTAWELKSWGTESTWRIYYTDDGYVLLQNRKSGLCIQYYGTEWGAIEHSCNEDKDEQKVLPVLTETGGLQLLFARMGEICLYSAVHLGKFYPYTGVCKSDDEYTWALIPAKR
jgi:cytolethal distending toxin subunit A